MQPQPVFVLFSADVAGQLSPGQAIVEQLELPLVLFDPLNIRPTNDGCPFVRLAHQLHVQEQDIRLFPRLVLVCLYSR
jgi:hypothetical protein